MTPIFHIAEQAAWDDAAGGDQYLADSLATQGFIHCSTTAQVLEVANRIFQGRHDLVLLVIDPARLRSPVRYEHGAGSADPFPHVYGAIDVSAVAQVVEFRPTANGTFELPAGLLPMSDRPTANDDQIAGSG